MLVKPLLFSAASILNRHKPCIEINRMCECCCKCSILNRHKPCIEIFLFEFSESAKALLNRHKPCIEMLGGSILYNEQDWIKPTQALYWNIGSVLMLLLVTWLNRHKPCIEMLALRFCILVYVRLNRHKPCIEIFCWHNIYALHFD